MGHNKPGFGVAKPQGDLLKILVYFNKSRSGIKQHTRGANERFVGLPPPLRELRLRGPPRAAGLWDGVRAAAHGWVSQRIGIPRKIDPKCRTKESLRSYDFLWSFVAFAWFQFARAWGLSPFVP
jgi:hypothetical protein